jgi:hypothetical protein
MGGNFTFYSVDSTVFIMEISTLENETITLSTNVALHTLTQYSEDRRPLVNMRNHNT